MDRARTLLVVEDDEDVRDALDGALAGAGYVVATATNGAAALRHLKESAELPALVLLDLMMPVMNGEELLSEMRKDVRLSALPVVVFTADRDATTKAAELGVRGVVQKPVSLEELLLVLSATWEQPA